jgi:hypothetical protein
MTISAWGVLVLLGICVLALEHLFVVRARRAESYAALIAFNAYLHERKVRLNSS